MSLGFLSLLFQEQAFQDSGPCLLFTFPFLGWRHQRDGCEFCVNSGISDGQVSLACSSPWGRRESDTEQQLLNNNNSNYGISGRLLCNFSAQVSHCGRFFSSGAQAVDHVGFSSCGAWA